MTNEMKSSPELPLPAAPMVNNGQEAIRAVVSPLAGVDPRSLDALMAEDVELLTNVDVDRIVEELRAQRAAWARNEEATALKKAAGPRAKSPRVKGTITDLDLTDLGF